MITEADLRSLPLRKSDYSPSLDEVRWNFGDAIHAGGVKVVAQYRCGGDGRSCIGRGETREAILADLKRQMEN